MNVSGPWLTSGMPPIQPPSQTQTRDAHRVSSRLSSLVSGPWPIAFDSVVTRLQASEQRLRGEQAAQVALFAEALDQASLDHFATLRTGRLVHDHAQAELRSHDPGRTCLRARYE